jgi:hypothetical protein
MSNVYRLGSSLCWSGFAVNRRILLAVVDGDALTAIEYTRFLDSCSILSTRSVSHNLHFFLSLLVAVLNSHHPILNATSHAHQAE